MQCNRGYLIKSSQFSLLLSFMYLISSIHPLHLITYLINQRQITYGNSKIIFRENILNCFNSNWNPFSRIHSLMIKIPTDRHPIPSIRIHPVAVTIIHPILPGKEPSIKSFACCRYYDPVLFINGRGHLNEPYGQFILKQ